MDVFKDSVEDLLREWGKAAREATPRLGYKPQMLGRVKGSTVKAASIDPETYRLVDEGISKLIIENEALYDVAGYIFINCMTYRQIARRVGRCERTICSHKKTIIEHIADHLNKNN